MWRRTKTRKRNRQRKKKQTEKRCPAIAGIYYGRNDPVYRAGTKKQKKTRKAPSEGEQQRQRRDNQKSLAMSKRARSLAFGVNFVSKKTKQK